MAIRLPLVLLKRVLINDVIGFSSKEDLESMINGNGEVTRSSVCRFKVGDKFISLLDPITPSYEHWEDFSKEEQDSILTYQLTYYDALGYEELVPNENFAKLLNYKGEVIVDDSLYRITPLGTFCSDTLNYKELDACHNMLTVSNDSVSFNGSNCIRLSPTVILYPTFASTSKGGFQYNTRAGSAIPLKYYGSMESNGWVWKKLAKLFGKPVDKAF